MRAAVGGIVGYFGISLLMRHAGPALILGGSGAIALAGVAFVYLLMAVFVGAGILVPRQGAKLLNVAGPDDLVDQRAILAGSALSSGALGAGLLALALAGPAGVVPNGIALAALGVCTIITLAVGIKQWPSHDELMRQVAMECGAVAYGLAMPLLGGWSALAYLGMAPAVQPLWIVTALASLLLVASFIAAGRRGLLNQRG